MATGQSSSTSNDRNPGRKTAKRASVFTTGEVAKICQVAPRTVSKWIDTGSLQGWRIPGPQGGQSDRRVSAAEMEVFLSRHDMAHRIPIVRRACVGEDIDSVIRDIEHGPDNAHLDTLNLAVANPANEPQGLDDSGYVYFFRLSHAGPVKIGFSYDPDERLKKLGQGAPKAQPIRMLGVMLGGRPHEKSLHGRFATLRLGGEWFRPAPELMDFIAQNAVPLELLEDDVEHA